jgi:hypothetical protein
MYWAKLTTIALVGGLPAINAQISARMLRFACSQLVVERLDPLVSSGIIGSPHTHQVVGGNSFNATMEPVVYDLPTKSSCTSCTFSEDFSNYWTAAMYHRARNGTFKRVAQFPNDGLKQNGGINVYYIPPYDGVTNVTALKPVSGCGHFKDMIHYSSLSSPWRSLEIEFLEHQSRSRNTLSYDEVEYFSVKVLMNL